MSLQIVNNLCTILSVVTWLNSPPHTLFRISEKRNSWQMTNLVPGYNMKDCLQEKFAYITCTHGHPWARKGCTIAIAPVTHGKHRFLSTKLSIQLCKIVKPQWNVAQPLENTTRTGGCPQDYLNFRSDFQRSSSSLVEMQICAMIWGDELWSAFSGMMHDPQTKGSNVNVGTSFMQVFRYVTYVWRRFVVASN